MSKFTTVDTNPTRLPPVYGHDIHPLLPLQEALNPIILKIRDLQKFITIAKSECHFPSKHGLTREESASIYIYTMDWGNQSIYRLLNAALRENDRSVLVPWYGYMKLFDTALKKLPSVQKSLWRGVNVDVSDNYRTNTEVTWWHFTSCSSVVSVVQKFLGPTATLFMIDAKNGKDVSLYSNFPDEREVILGLGTQVRVQGHLDHEALKVVHCSEHNNQNNKVTTSAIQISIRKHPNSLKSKRRFFPMLVLHRAIIVDTH